MFIDLNENIKEGVLSKIANQLSISNQLLFVRNYLQKPMLQLALSMLYETTKFVESIDTLLEELFRTSIN